MSEHTLIAIDLAKSVFQVCLYDTVKNKALFNKRLSRDKLMAFIAKQASSRIVMEACYSANFWGRSFQALGYRVDLIPAQHVKPFVVGNKTDHNDALAIAEAACRPRIRFVPVKTQSQQDIQCLHRVRERLIRSKTTLTNQARGLLSEYGIVFNQGHKAFTEAMVSVRESQALSPAMQELMQGIYEEYSSINVRIKEINKKLENIVENDELCQILKSMRGVGNIIASAIVSKIGDGSGFDSARAFAVWVGLTPKQQSSGHKSMMQGISKRGDSYLRKQLVHGARVFMLHARESDDRLSRWVNGLIERRGYNKAAVALAHRMARIAWTLLHKKEPYKTF